jgi:C1A family cysteine protease
MRLFDIFKERVPNRYGWKPDVPDHRDYKFNHMAMLVITPDVVDLRPKMPPVYNQGELGSCTANSIGAAFQYDQIKLNQPNWVPSRLMIYYLERKLEGTVNEDAGAQIRDGIKVVAKYGVAPETAWPYDIAKYKKAPPASVMKLASYHQALTYARVEQTQEALEQTLAQGFVVPFGFSVYTSFESPTVAKTGIVPMPTKSERSLGGHAVTIVGYDRPKKLFIVRNSWGPDWGQAGYFEIPYAYVLNPNLADDFWVIYTVEDGDGK